jgi:histidinol-phosphate aminotransferase
MSSYIWNLANSQLRDVVSYEPGRPIEDVARDMGLDPANIIKLASNENPLGPSPKALAAMHDALDRVHYYPDGGGQYLREAIGEQFGLQRENVILGNGSNEIIEFVGHAFLRPGDEVITARHAFAVYSIVAQLFDARLVEVPDPAFHHDLEAMAAAITPQTREVFITNPNNPTGTMAAQDDIDRFMDNVPDHVIVIFDEAYHEFVEHPPDTLKYVHQGRENVVVLRTFSKIQGLAGLRIGYGLGTRSMIGVLQKTRQPFNANAIAQAGAIAGLKDREHIYRTRELVGQGRDFLEENFSFMGLDYVPSQANFVMVDVGDGNAVFKALMEKGVIVRSMASYQLPAWIRVTVGTMPQNHRFIDALTAVLAAMPPVA